MLVRRWEVALQKELIINCRPYCQSFSYRYGSASTLQLNCLLSPAPLLLNEVIQKVN
jgi:hypothetical protein